MAGGRGWSSSAPALEGADQERQERHAYEEGGSGSLPPGLASLIRQPP